MGKNSTIDELRKDTDIIWHYTSMDVFKKIMFGETGLYATHVRFLNDSSEFRYGWNIIESLSEKYLHRLKKEARDTKDICKHFDSIKGQARNEHINGKIRNWKKTDVYVTCFSKDCDSLYQWRCYTPGGGVCIGFSRKELQEKIFGVNAKNIGNIRNAPLKKFSYSGSSSEQDTLGCLCECLYTEELQEKTIQEILFSNSYLNDIDVFFLACLMKHESFSFEKEERIVYSGISCFDKIEMIGEKPRIPILGASKNEVCQLIKGVVVSPHGNKEHNLYLAHLWAHKCNLTWEPALSRSPYIGG